MPTPAACMGYGEPRIIFRHLLPNAITPAIVYWMTDMALAILLGSSLGYLGLGAQPPAAEWGVLIADGKNFMTTAWWISVFPGIAIVVTGLGFSLLGDGLAELGCGAGGDDGRGAAAQRARTCGSRSRRAAEAAIARRRRRPPASAPGEVLGLVGESGSGKSVTLRSIVRLVRPPGACHGDVRWRGADLLAAAGEPAARDPRARDRHDLPGADDGAQSRAPGRRADRRKPPGP